MSESYTDEPAPRPRQPADVQADAPEAAESLPKLGSLAQAARGNQLRNARNILLFIGIITLLFTAVQLALVRGEVKREIDQEITKQAAVGKKVDPAARAQFEEQLVMVQLVLVGLIGGGEGIAFVILGVLVKRFPVPATIIGLVLYILDTVVGVLLNPAAAGALIIRVIFIVALSKAIQAAFAYEREKREQLAVQAEY